MECKFTVGQKVVCVDDVPRHYPSAGVKYGSIYTITKIGIHHTRECPVVWLSEEEALGEWGFYADRFRPIQDTKKETSIEVFRDILRKVSEPEKVE